MERSMFFDSTADDKRRYTSKDFADFMATFYSTGVLNGGESLKTSRSTAGLSVDLSPGYAVINGHWYQNSAPLNLIIEAADPSYPRIDRVVLRLDLTIEKRNITAMVLTGAPAAQPQPPALVRNDNYYDISLAQVAVPVNAAAAGAVTDERYDAQVCGLCNGLFTVDLSEFESRLDGLLADMKAQAQRAVDSIAALSNATLLEKIKAVDGAGSGVDADLLDGQHGAYYLNYQNLTNKPTLSALGGQRQILSGTAAPSGSLGQNGDVYIQYS